MPPKEECPNYKTTLVHSSKHFDGHILEETGQRLNILIIKSNKYVME